MKSEFQNSHTVETAFKTYYHLLCFYAEKIVGKDAAKDIVSEVFAKLLENREIMENVHSTLAYLRKSVQNHSLQHIKQVKKLRGYIGYVNEIPDLHHLHDNDDPLSMIISMEMLDEINRAINSLPEKCHKIFLLVRMEGYSYHETAVKLGISVNSVHTQISRAMSKLHNFFGTSSNSLNSLIYKK